MNNFLSKLITVFGCIFFTWLALPLLIYGILITGNIAGMAVSLVLILYGTNFEKVNDALKKFREEKKGKIFFSVVSCLLVLAVGFAAVEGGLMLSASVNKPQEETTVVVLGCQVKKDGPSLMLLRRLQAAQKYLKENPEIKCIVSGGKGDDEAMSEAECMRDWLIENGIEKERIFTEDKSTSTRENLEFSKQIIRRENLCEKITIVTNEFHQYRAGRIAKNLGFEHYSLSGNTPVVLLPTYIVREMLAIAYEWIR